MTAMKSQTKSNIAVSILYQLTAAVCSLILPRYILMTFGSDVNGVLQSIGQLLNYTVLMECGVGGLITASFYKPLADGDREYVSDIFNNARTFFNRISYVYIALTVILAFTVKLYIHTEFDFGYVCTLVIILGTGYYFSYYFAMAQRLLMKADQKLRIVQATQSITLICNTVVCIMAIKLGAGIHVVKILSALVLLANPIVFRIYVKRHYDIRKTLYEKNRSFPRKSDGMVHHIAFFIHMNTDIVLISAVCGTKEVSVYSVYNSVICAIENFFTAVSESVSAALGSLIAKEQQDGLKASFEFYQIVNTAAATFVCAEEAIMILPFVKMYTSGVTDAHYIRPLFAYLMIAAQWFFCIRLPYNNIINSAGHYRQTKLGAYLEVIFNIGISVPAVFRFGIVGAAFGTLVAMAIRAAYMAWYLSQNLLYRKVRYFVRDIGLNLLLAVAVVWAASRISIPSDSPIRWILYASGIGIGIVAILVLFNLAVYRTTVFSALKKMREK